MRVYHFLATVTVAWSCGFYSIGLGQEGALPVTTDLHAHGLNQQQLDSLADIERCLVKTDFVDYELGPWRTLFRPKPPEINPK